MNTDPRWALRETSRMINKRIDDLDARMKMLEAPARATTPPSKSRTKIFVQAVDAQIHQPGDLVLVYLPQNCSIEGSISVMRERLLEAIGIARRLLDTSPDEDEMRDMSDRLDELENE